MKLDQDGEDLVGYINENPRSLLPLCIAIVDNLLLM